MKTKITILTLSLVLLLSACSGETTLREEGSPHPTSPSAPSTDQPGPGSSSSSTPTFSGVYSLSEGSITLSAAAYDSTHSDVNTILVTGGTLTLTDCTITKSAGGTSNSDNSSFYGTNAAVLATSSGTINMNGGTISTSAEGANGIVAYGGYVNVSDVTITTAGRLSRGIHATGGGTINASNLDITTNSNNSSVIALDKGGGTVTVNGGTYRTTSSSDSAILYSTGTLSVSDISGESAKGEIGVIEGDNSITITDSTLSSGSANRGLMILQSGSGDGGDGINGVITISGGSLTTTDSGAPFIEIVTNVNGTVSLDNVTTSIASGILMEVDYNTQWSTSGATGILNLSGSTTYKGSIVADSYSSASVTVGSKTVWEGAFDTADTAKSTTLVIEGGTWILTGDSYVDEITIKGGNIDRNGYTLTCADLTNNGGTIEG